LETKKIVMKLRAC